MSIGLLVVHVALLSTAFLVVLNGYLRGAAKTKTDGCSVLHAPLIWRDYWTCGHEA
jgi:hypothetical protein